MSLPSLPTEILVDVFFSLGGYTVMRCKEVCKIFRRIISTNVKLQYKSKLYCSSMIDCCSSFPLMSSQERLTALNAYLNARISSAQSWPEGELDRCYPPNSSYCWTYCSKVLTYIREPETVISFAFLNRHAPTPFHQMTFLLKNIGNPEAGEPETDPRQDLLIIFGITQNQHGDRGYGMSMLSLSDGSPHPRAQQSSILLDLIEHTSIWDSAEIYHDFFAMLISRPEDNNSRIGTLAVFNWVTGTLDHNITVPEGCFVFIDKEHILAGVVNLEMDRIELRVYRLGREDPILTFPFPKSSHLDCFSYAYLRRNSPNFSDAFPQEQYTLPFTSDPSNRVIAFVMAGEHPKHPWQIQSVFPISAITSYINHNPMNCLEVPWGQWPQCTFGWPTLKARITVSGNRIAIGNLALQTITIYDFHERWWAKQLVPLYCAPWTQSYQTIRLPQDEQIIKVKQLGVFWLDEDMLIVLVEGRSIEYLRI
ncbi:hypothetical protein BDN72DRAFT_848105 [Pluteus cervinus]|uniref:Uncharacterized protein n=1 Tax=Pluteus cervinus TaxID=181527 RepID=A0ACD3AC60_9AGAR|nr:hypothetical protein BDN72DRAFT_848105 [Pluteus cervinus]